MEKIKIEVIEQLKANTKAKNRLAYEFANHIMTIDRWIENNNPMLTTKTALNAISEELGIKEKDLLETE